MTGRGAGFCAGYPAPGYANPAPGGFGYGRGFGRGYGRGFGRGFGRGYRRRWAAAPYAYDAPYANTYNSQALSPEQEAQALREETQVIEEELAAMRQRIKELESRKQDNG
jgi:hypothetical protein